MTTLEPKRCKLPGCDRIVTSWRMTCCCKSHQGIYSAKMRHGTLGKPNQSKEDFAEYAKGRAKFMKSFVGPHLPKIPRPRYTTDIIVQKIKKASQKPTEQRKSEWSAYVVNRRKKRDLSMPPWANKEKILEFYIEARRLTAETGIPHEVDHIIPSNHKLVCGLHCEFNLQVLPQSENRQKNNKFFID